MELKKVWAMYFSPTGGTEKAVKTTAQVVAEKLNLPLEIYDFTLPQGRENGCGFRRRGIWLSAAHLSLRGVCQMYCFPI